MAARQDPSSAGPYKPFFISFAGEDLLVAKEVVSTIEYEVVQDFCFLDEESITYGVDLDEIIFAALRRAWKVFWIVSENSLKKPYPLCELLVAIGLKRKVALVLPDGSQKLEWSQKILKALQDEKLIAKARDDCPESLREVFEKAVSMFNTKVGSKIE